jgi:hypothetical protein
MSAQDHPRPRRTARQHKRSRLSVGLMTAGMFALATLAGFGFDKLDIDPVADDASSRTSTDVTSGCVCLGHVPGAGIQWLSCPDQLWGRKDSQDMRSRLLCFGLEPGS